MADTKDLKADVDALRADLSKLRSDLGELTSTLLDLGKDTAAVARDRLRDGAEEGVERVRDALRRLRARGGDAAEAVQRQIESHPAVTLVAAFGLGFVIGRVLDRS